jgi:hypothetical protein
MVHMFTTGIWADIMTNMFHIIQINDVVFKYMFFHKPNDIITDFSVICFGTIIKSF